MLKVEPRITRVNKNIRMRQEMIDLLAELAEVHDSTEGKVMEALIETYAPGLIRSQRKESEK